MATVENPAGIHLMRTNPFTLPDGELLERYLRVHDERAFNALIQRYRGLVLGVCQRVLSNRHDVEDAFQGTFLVLVEQADSLDRRGPLGPWLQTVAYRTALKTKIRAARRREQAAAGAAAPVSSDAGDPDWKEVRSVVNEELSRLPEKYRVALVLCDLEGQTHQQAARRLGWPAGSVSYRLMRGRALLRKRLVNRGIASSVVLVLLLTRRAPAGAPVLPATMTDPATRLPSSGRRVLWWTARLPKLGIARVALAAKLFAVKVLVPTVCVLVLAGVVSGTRSLESVSRTARHTWDSCWQALANRGQSRLVPFERSKS